MNEFEKELEHLLNQHSIENESNTPDFMLASFLMACLRAWNETTKAREKWYGRSTVPGAGICSPWKRFDASELSLLRELHKCVISDETLRKRIWKNVKAPKPILEYEKEAEACRKEGRLLKRLRNRILRDLA